jgi:hypothetical protein
VRGWCGADEPRGANADRMVLRSGTAPPRTAVISGGIGHVDVPSLAAL